MADRSRRGGAAPADGSGANQPERESSSEATRMSLGARTALFMSLWYACSGATLFGNKHILSTLKADPNVLAMSQMLITALFGAVKMYGPSCVGGKPHSSPLSTQESRPLRNFLVDMLIVGVMRFATVMAGLISLKYVAVSFTETVKSSAPFFTVLFARILLKEHTSLAVNLSLLPVVAGLALCSANELSFTPIGFFAAVFNNCIDCVQNVFSKKLLSTHYNYINLQFYTSAAALVVQLPILLLRPVFIYGQREEAEESTGLNRELLFYLILNGAFFHLQSVMAYGVMGLISPVSQSVANTLKRALLIWLSVLYFGNPVTWASACGTSIVIGGVFAYNHARRYYPYRPPPDLPISSCNCASSSSNRA
ncbi:hypothetical protein AB1Y20_001862 [Prymnesium parvum]|uniref:Sugar phosphate transporter domain-containing protein n=1 Tax=Prymnesium parvum TaxID=97485 RepID=A0AB34J6Z1_PRYPA